jgi:S-methylmethionine-dependent homocysteine/selenocysteine methylase
VAGYARVQALLDADRPALLDGGLGSELVRRGVRWRWHGLRTDPQEVSSLHVEYIEAGADVIRTNTSQLNHRLYLNVFRSPDHMRHIGAPGLETRAHELTLKALALARQARDTSGRDVAIAGVMAPLEHPFRPDLAPDPAASRPEHWQIASWLKEGGVDFILLESMNTVGEARAAAEAALSSGLPVWASFVIGPEGKVLGGDDLAEGARAMQALGVKAVLVNCAPPEDIGPAVEGLATETDLPVGAFAHIGKFDPPSWKFEFHPQFAATDAWPPDRYAEAAAGWRDAGARVVGGCCGTGPAHVAALRDALGPADGPTGADA